MNTPRKSMRWFGMVAAALIVLAMAACQHMAMMNTVHAVPPAESEFGFGPRSSAGGTYTATLASDEPLRARRMQSVLLTVHDSAGNPVEAAVIDVDGGMPEHGHGLPTDPRVTRELGEGKYLVEGLRFNMGGWWQLTFDVSGPGGAERVTFNVRV